jgi:hypothetical protein
MIKDDGLSEVDSFFQPISKKATQWHIFAILAILILHVIFLCLIFGELVRINDRTVRLILEENSATQKK